MGCWKSAAETEEGEETWKEKTRKRLSEIREERAVARPSGIQTPHFLALKPKRRSEPKRKCCARFTSWTLQIFSGPWHIQEVRVSQHPKGSWGQAHKMSQLWDDDQSLWFSPILTMSQTWHWVIPGSWTQVHEASEAGSGGGCKRGNPQSGWVLIFYQRKSDSEL